MKTVSMSGSLRENVGKKDAKAHRREGKIPCVLYGGKDQIHFTLDDKEFSKIIFTPEVYIINLKVDGKEHTAILQDVQYHPVTDRVLHADFLQVLDGKPVVIGIPIKLEGAAPGRFLLARDVGDRASAPLHRLAGADLLRPPPQGAGHQGLAEGAEGVQRAR